MKYRSDIDGLRAIAVALVIFFHAGLSQFPAGFIGVDVFFVISGYLISKIILDGTNDQKFNLSNFYTRRIWRLQPSLLLIVFISIIIGSIFYLPADYNTFLHSVKNVLYFTSNQYFSGVTTSYASEDSSYLLLLHTWSLSIEWQWYLTFPVILYFTLKSYQKDKVALANYVITAVFLIVSLYLSYTTSKVRYYDFFSRCFELQIGSCIAFTSFKIGHKLSNIVGIVSLSLIIILSMSPELISGYPNGYTLVVALATGAIILSGESSRSYASRLLASNSLVAIGKRSYSLYLWHWPCLALLHYMDVFNDSLLLISLLASSLLLACVSYSYIEMPLRKCNKNLKASILLLIVTPLLLSIVLYSVAKNQNYFPWRFGSSFNTATNLELKYKKMSGHRSDCLTDEIEGKYSNKHCTFGVESPKKTAFFIGDSNSNHYWMFLETLAKDANLAITAKSTASCLTLPGIYQFDWWHFSNTVYETCHENTKQYYEQIENNKFDYVIIGELWPMYVSDKIINNQGDTRTLELSKERLSSAINEALTIIEKAGSTPVIMKEIFNRPDGYEYCLKRKLIGRNDFENGECSSLHNIKPSPSWFDEKFEELKKSHPSLLIIDIKDVQCSVTGCATEVNGVSVYRDVGHLNDYASHVFGQMYLQSKGNPFIK